MKKIAIFLFFGATNCLFAQEMCSNNFNNTTINASEIREINIICEGKKFIVPKFEGQIQPWSINDFKENGFKGISDLSDFLFDHEDQIVYLRIWPYYTDEKMMQFEQPGCLALTPVPGIISNGTEACFEEEREGLSVDSRQPGRSISGYIEVGSPTGPYPGGFFGISLKPLSTREVYQIAGGKPDLLDVTAEYKLEELSFEEVLKKYNIKNYEQESNSLNNTSETSSVIQNYSTPRECELIVASRRTLPEVRQYIQENITDRRYLKVLIASNGWYAISIGTLKPHEEETVMRKWKASGKIPQDSFCASSEKMITEVKWQ